MTHSNPTNKGDFHSWRNSFKHNLANLCCQPLPWLLQHTFRIVELEEKLSPRTSKSSRLQWPFKDEESGSLINYIFCSPRFRLILTGGIDRRPRLGGAGVVTLLTLRVLTWFRKCRSRCPLLVCTCYATLEENLRAERPSSLSAVNALIKSSLSGSYHSTVALSKGNWSPCFQTFAQSWIPSSCLHYGTVCLRMVYLGTRCQASKSCFITPVQLSTSINSMKQHKVVLLLFNSAARTCRTGCFIWFSERWSWFFGRKQIFGLRIFWKPPWCATAQAIQNASFFNKQLDHFTQARWFGNFAI